MGSVEVIVDEMDATRRALDRARPGDIVLLCVDYATEVWKELESRRSLAQPSYPSGGTSVTAGGTASAAPPTLLM